MPSFYPPLSINALFLGHLKLVKATQKGEMSPGIKLGNSYTEGCTLTNCATLAPFLQNPTKIDQDTRVYLEQKCERYISSSSLTGKDEGDMNTYDLMSSPYDINTCHDRKSFLRPWLVANNYVLVIKKAERNINFIHCNCNIVEIGIVCFGI